MKKRILFASLSVVGVATALTAGFILSNNKKAKAGLADEPTYTITLDATTMAGADGSGSAVVQSNNGGSVRFDYTGLTIDSGQLVFENGATILNPYLDSGDNNYISGIKQIATTYSGENTGAFVVDYTWGDSLKVASPYYQRRGYVINSSSDPNKVYSFLDERPNFLKVTATADSTVESMTISFSCERHAEAGENLVIMDGTHLERLKTVVLRGNSFEGQTVELGADIDMNGITTLPIGNAQNLFKGTFDGKNHTISNFSISATTGQRGLFGKVLGATIKNFTMANASIVTTASQAGIVAGVSDGGVFENITIASGAVQGSQEIGGFVGTITAAASGVNTVFKDCVNHATVTGTTGNCVGGIAGYIGNGGVTMYDCENYGNITAADGKSAGGIVGKFVSAAVAGASDLNVCTVGDEVIVKSGDTAITDNFGNSGLIAGTNGSSAVCRGTGVIERHIKNLADFDQLATDATAGSGTFRYKVIILDTDLDFGSADHSINCVFAGTIDGKGHTISNFTKKTGDQVGLINALTFGGIKNLKLTNLDLEGASGNYRAGAITGRLEQACIKNVEASGEVKGKQVGGFVGVTVISKTVFMDCVNKMNVTAVSGASGVGGFIGATTATSPNIYIKNCENQGTITNTGNSNTGGFVGSLGTVSAATTYIFEDCLNSGAVSGKVNVGGFVGDFSSKVADKECNLTITRCENTGAISATNDGSSNLYTFCGGIVGVSGGTSETTKVQSVYISDCVNRGTVTTTGKYNGGITGLVRASKSDSYITRCFNYGDVSGVGCVGGVNGESRIATTYCGCYTGVTLTYDGNAKLASSVNATGNPGYIATSYTSGASADEKHVGNRLINADGSDYTA